MVDSVKYNSNTSYINSYYLGRTQSGTSAVSSFTNMLSGTSSTLLPLDTPQQATITRAIRDVQSLYGQLKTATASLQSGKVGNVFDKRSVDTSNSSAVTATVQDRAKQATYTIGVSQLAASQQNTGKVFTSAGKASDFGFTAGQNKLTLTMGSTTKQVSFTVNNDDSNKTVLTNMASAINNANFGISAKVVDTTTASGTSSKLLITADKTGTDKAFSLADVSGNAVAASGANTTTTAAQNAKYSIGSTDYTSQSNAISLDKGKLAVTLKAVTSEPVSLTVKPDRQALTKSVAEFAEVYNKAVEVFKDNGDKLSSRALQNLTRSVNNNRVSLSNIGITVNSDKTLTVDTAKLEKAASANYEQVSRVIGGIAGQISRTSAAVNSSWSQGEITNITGSANTYQTQLYQYRSSNLSAMLGSLYNTGSFLDLYL